MQKQTRPEDGRKAACGNVAAAHDKARLAANALRGLHAQLATIGYPSERWSTGKTWLGGHRRELQSGHLHLWEEEEDQGKTYEKEEEDEEEGMAGEIEGERGTNLRSAAVNN